MPVSGPAPASASRRVRLVPPLRSLLFLPAIAPALLPKATLRGADALIVDLEDSVPPNRKIEARAMAIAAVRELSGRGATVVLRVNAEPAQWRADIADMPLELLMAIFLPKVEEIDQVESLSSALRARMDAHQTVPAIVALVESPRGVLAASTIASHPGLAALGFGSEDYAAAVGLAPEPAALGWPAHQVVTCAHAFGLQCWGLPASIADVDDLETFERSVRAGRAMGFTGSVCIHPRQVEIVNRGFSPTADELAWAARVVQADQLAQSSGQGAVLLDGRMIDRPIVDRARRWLSGALKT